MVIASACNDDRKIISIASLSVFRAWSHGINTILNSTPTFSMFCVNANANSNGLRKGDAISVEVIPELLLQHNYEVDISEVSQQLCHGLSLHFVRDI